MADENDGRRPYVCRRANRRPRETDRASPLKA